MSLVTIVKNHLTRLPYQVGSLVSLIPYSYRPGIAEIYRKRRAEVQWLEKSSAEQQQEFVVNRIRSLVTHSYLNVPFYTDLYRSAGIAPKDIRCFDDILNLPVIRKSDLQSVPLEYRSAKINDRYVVNTGGSTGQPLGFYIEPSSVGHEWAHMHLIWAKLGFTSDCLKVALGGRSDIRNVIEYDSVRHHLAADIYAGWSVVAEQLQRIFHRYKPTYLHGYPSAIFDFVLWLDANRHPLLPMLRGQLKGMFLGSEFPSPMLREEVESLLDCKGVSWYGHTERCILAYEEREYGAYSPFLSYGFAEAVNDLGAQRLVGTSYYNYASPLIRYDTGDSIEPNIESGILKSFRILHGREGDFILDKRQNRIFLTGLIYGRHHALFEHARYIQLYQDQFGVAEVLVVPRDENMTPQLASTLFDGSNVAVDFIFRMVAEPIRTSSGKVCLLVKVLNS